MSLKVLELFCGAGSFSIQMNKLGIKHEIVGFSDILDTALRLFCKIHDRNIDDNLGDIRNVNGIGMDVDLVVFGSKCQDFTRAGKGKGGTKGSGTGSSLMWEAVRIIDECKPKWIIWENVSDAVNKTHMPNFIDYMNELDKMGYNTYWEVLNAHELGSAQKRKRLFAVSVKKDIDNGEFKFKYDKIEPKKLKDYLEHNVGEEYRVEQKIVDALWLGTNEEGYMIKNATKQGYAMAQEGDAIDTGFYNSTTRRGRVQKDACQTLLRSKSIATIQNGVMRYLTPLEYWRLQEMDDDMYNKVLECEFSQNEAYDVIGGVINQKHLKVVLGSMSDCFGWEIEK